MNTETKKSITILAVAVVIIALIAFFVYQYKPSGSAQNPPATNTTNQPIPSFVFDQSVSDGTVTFLYPSSEFGLATTPSQILATSYIPPCDQGFNYCLYYKGADYQGTNFESAGIRMQKRADLTTEQLCLNTPPEGYSASTLPTSQTSAGSHSASVFANVGDAAAGHFASGSLYRLFVKSNSACYEFAPRIGQTQFQNYPAGAIKEFTSQDAKTLQAKLDEILSRVTLGIENNLFQWYK